MGQVTCYEQQVRDEALGLAVAYIGQDVIEHLARSLVVLADVKVGQVQPTDGGDIFIFLLACGSHQTDYGGGRIETSISDLQRFWF